MHFTAHRRGLMAALAISLAVFASADARSEQRPVLKLVIPFAPGGGTDLVARLMAPKLSEILKRDIIIENVAGAGGRIATLQVATAKPDGNTLLMTTAAHAVNGSLYKNEKYDAIRSFAPVALVGKASYMLLVNSTSKIDSVSAFIAAAKASNAPFTYATSGVGSAEQMAGELFKQMAGVELVHVPFRGGGPANIALLSGQVTCWFGAIAGGLQSVKGGRLRVLAVTGIKRSAALPNVPTISESGLAGYDITGWYGVLAPAGTPANVVEEINHAVTAASNAPGIRERLLLELGVETDSMPPAEVTHFLQNEIAKYVRIAKISNIKVD